ncbi:MAG: ligase-associated DNA damage response endonuclease PdeM [Cyclobacteriaceae bacterium]|nr:ligase-associated DNA damage response endonuclease PdeM [Cyclobacteriaceae bacterium]UYN88197.1 MAG: ligase-associated DNA damage response endonuclease PdeM [Cyclobacteriaceae bacterium]
MDITIFNETFELLPQRAVWWKKHNMILLADMHLGKVNHFRKAGIPVPVKANEKNWEVLIDLVQTLKPQRVVCIGDLFHSHYNYDWELVGEFTRAFHHVSFELVTGNHDVLTHQQYNRCNIVLHGEGLRVDRFLFSHFPLAEPLPGVYVISGHIHPGVQLLGRGKQRIMLPCYYFGEHQGYLPAFGMFTGLSRIQPKMEDRIFAIADNTVIKI